MPEADALRVTSTGSSWRSSPGFVVDRAPQDRSTPRRPAPSSTGCATGPPANRRQLDDGWYRPCPWPLRPKSTVCRAGLRRRIGRGRSSGRVPVVCSAQAAINTSVPIKVELSYRPSVCPTSNQNGARTSPTPDPSKQDRTVVAPQGPKRLTGVPGLVSCPDRSTRPAEHLGTRPENTGRTPEITESTCGRSAFSPPRDGANAAVDRNRRNRRRLLPDGRRARRDHQHCRRLHRDRRGDRRLVENMGLVASGDADPPSASPTPCTAQTGTGRSRASSSR